MGSQRVRHDWADKTSNYSSDPPWMRLQCSHCPFWLAHVCQGSPSSGFSLFFQVVILYYHEAMGMTLGTGWCSCDQWHRILGHLLTQLTGTLWFCSAWSGCIISNMWCLLLLCLGRSNRTQLTMGSSGVYMVTLCTMVNCSVLAKVC